jgi:hypothetical protein
MTDTSLLLSKWGLMAEGLAPMAKETALLPTRTMLPWELLLAIMECLANHENAKKSLLEMMLTCRGAYELGLSPLLRVFGFQAGKHLDCIAAAPIDLFGNNRLERMKDVWIVRSDALSGEQYRDLFLGVVPSLVSLRVEGDEEKTVFPLYDVLRATKGKLKKLEFTIDAELADLTTSDCYLPPSIETLHLHFFVIEDSSAEPFEAVVRQQLPNLKHVWLTIECPDSIGPLRHYPVFASKIDLLKTWAWTLLNLDARSCSQLPRLIIVNEYYEIEPCVHDHLHKFPSLEELDLCTFSGNYDWSTADLALIILRAPKSLKRLQMNGPKYNLPAADRNAVRQGLESRQIRVEINFGAYEGTPEEKEEEEFWKSLPSVTWRP